MKIHGHSNGLKTAFLFGLLWALIFGVWYLAGGNYATLWIYALIAVATTFGSYWFSDQLSLASMQAVAVDESQAPGLYRIVRELAAKAGKPMPRIYIAPTMSPNAFATGRNERHAAVCCTRGILNLLDERELRGVLGHELMHVYNRDILTSSIASAMAIVVSYLGYSLQYFGRGSSRDRDEQTSGIATFGAILAIVLAPISASLIQMAISRTREFDADEDGARLTGDPLALADALRKIESGVESVPLDKTAGTENVSASMIASPFRAADISKLLSTHPPTDERIARLEDMAYELGRNPSGESPAGETYYQA